MTIFKRVVDRIVFTTINAIRFKFEIVAIKLLLRYNDAMNILNRPYA